ncbi:MAG TPA: hypothetical protein VFW87_05550, partial [Pirellulales bacterium]|nr:hypothetical protein [Pirellulales bacterium]
LDSGRHGVPLFSPDAKYLATTPGGVTLWRTGDWKPLRQLHAQGTTPTGLSIAFSPDSRVLAVGHPGSAIRLIDPATGNEWAHLRGSDASTAAIMGFSPDQRLLIASTTDQRLPAQVWDLSAIRRALRKRGLDWRADVLESRPATPGFEGAIEVVLEHNGVFAKPDRPQADIPASQPQSAP